MRYWYFIAAIMMSLSALGQIDSRGRKPKITGQHVVSTNEEQTVTVQLTDLTVSDRDDWFYPIGFTLHVYEGNNYTLSNNSVTPVLNFNGTLSVPVSVNDGDKESDKFNLQIQVRPINDAPVVTGQQTVTASEDQSFTIPISQLVINDPDDTQFTLIVSAGTNYTFSGSTVTPAANFNGTLSVVIQVNDSKAISASYALVVTVAPVNDLPQITGQQSLETEENKSLAISLSNLIVTDPDDSYPADFTLIIQPPSPAGKYTVSGNQVIPALNFEGILSVPVQVNDGAASSNVYLLQVKVNHGNDAPTITGQTIVVVKEDEPIPLQLSQLTVTDTDNQYPSGFALHVLAGSSYTVTNNVVVPSADFYGPLIINVSVNDGANESNVYPMTVTITPVNDAPRISKFETNALVYAPGKGAVFITQVFEITDVDNDSLQQAEISFDVQNYLTGLDELLTINNPVIKGTFDGKRGVLSLTGKASVTEYVKFIRSVQYNFLTADDLEFETKKLYISVNDGKMSSDIVQREISLPKAMAVALDIPTAFTPNGDHANDTWSIRPLKNSDTIKGAIIRIYNRSGRLLFEAVGLDKEWDGRLNGELLPADTYFFTVDLDDQFSKTSVKGIVAILR
jgi:gliding motility-associated-like protein